MNLRRIVLGMLLAACCPVTAQGQIGVTGYVKDLLLQSESVFSGEPFWLNLSRGRMQLDWNAGAWRTEAWLDLEMQAGTFFDVPEAAFEVDTAAESLFDLEHEFGRGDRYRALGRVYRATASRYGERSTIVIGRQRIAWGTGFVWNPTDLLNPLSATALERDEKAAVDAVRISIPRGAYSEAEFVVAPGRRLKGNRVAARYRGHVGEYDWTLMAGRFGELTAVGGDFAGYVGNAAVRGEVTAVRDKSWDLRAVLNGDYTFTSGMYGLVEVHYNGPGAPRSSEYAPAISGFSQGLARWYAAASVMYPLTPLSTVSAYVVQNLVDGSALAGPAVSWSRIRNLDVTASVYGFVGSASSEFGMLSSVFFLQLQYYY